MVQRTSFSSVEQQWLLHGTWFILNCNYVLVSHLGSPLQEWVIIRYGLLDASLGWYASGGFWSPSGSHIRVQENTTSVSGRSISDFKCSSVWGHSLVNAIAYAEDVQGFWQGSSSLSNTSNGKPMTEYMWNFSALNTIANIPHSVLESAAQQG